MMKRLLVIVLVCIALIGCAATPVVRVSTLHVDRAEIILARQGIEENQTALQILMNAFLPVAEVSAAVMQPWVGAVIVSVHGIEAFFEKTGDTGGDVSETTVWQGEVDEVNVGFDKESGRPDKITVKMQGEE